MNIFRSKSTCGQCGKEYPGNSNFCPFCGAPGAGGKTRCGHCGAQVTSGDRFCHLCGRDLAAEQHPTMVGQTWSRGSSDFAARVDVEDVPGLFKRTVTVEPGTNAILIQAGRNMGVMPPGQYTLDTLLSRIGLSKDKPVTSILVDVGDTDLQFTLDDLYTVDPVRIALDCHIVLQLHNPVLFLTNLMRSARAYTLDQLRDFLGGEVDNAAREYVRQRKIQDLNSSVNAKRDIELDVEAHINRTLEETGLRLVQVRTLNYRCEKLDATRQTTEEYYLEISSHEAKLNGKQLLFEVLKREDVQALAEETQKVQVYEQRAALYDRMRTAVLSDKMNEVRNEQDLEKFLQGIDRDRLLRGNEMEEFKRDFAERKQDHDLARAHLAKLGLERDYERRQAELRLRTDLSVSQLQADLNVERQRVEGRLEIETRRSQLELALRRQQADFGREQQKLDDVTRREREVEQARAQAEIEGIEREQDRLDLELGMLALEKLKAKQRLDEEERNRIELERKARDLEIEIRRLDAELERRLRLERQQQEFELSKLERFATLSTDALIAVSGPEQGRMLTQLKETEALKGMSEEQILARAAEHSPQVAAAFAEKFRSNPEMQKQVVALYERMLAEQKDTAAGRDAMQRDVLAELRQMFERALESQRDIATAFARQQPQGTTVVMPQGGGSAPFVAGGVGLSQGTHEVVFCKECHSKWEVGTLYCPRCGTKLV
jgi:hypothetical protein